MAGESGGTTTARGIGQTQGGDKRGEKPNGGAQEEGKFRIPGIRVSTCPEFKGTLATPVHAQAEKANSATREATGDLPAKRKPASRAGDRTDQSDLTGMGKLL